MYYLYSAWYFSVKHFLPNFIPFLFEILCSDGYELLPGNHGANCERTDDVNIVFRTVLR